MGDYREIPNGKYVVEIIKAEGKKSKIKETLYINLWCLIIEGEESGHYLFKKICITEKALKYAKKDIKKLGYTGPIDDIFTAIVLDSFVNKKLTVTAKTKEKNGYTQTDVYFDSAIENYTPPSEPELPPEPDSPIPPGLVVQTDPQVHEVTVDQVDFIVDNEIPF